MAFLRTPYAYSKMEIEDAEELKHRRAQFLIYKVLEQADSRRRPSWFRVRITKLRMKIGKRLKRLRKSIILNIFTAKISCGGGSGSGNSSKQIISRLKTWKRLFRVRETMVSLPPMFS